jgi:hypothetical protein
MAFWTACLNFFRIPDGIVTEPPDCGTVLTSHIKKYFSAKALSGLRFEQTPAQGFRLHVQSFFLRFVRSRGQHGLKPLAAFDYSE